MLKYARSPYFAYKPSNPCLADPPIQEVIDAQGIPILLSMIQNPEQPQLLLEAAWALTNVCSGHTTHAHSIIDKDGIRLFINLLFSPNTAVVE